MSRSIVQRPGSLCGADGGRAGVASSTSLPTLLDLARPGLSAELTAPVDGRSLVGLLEGADEPERDGGRRVPGGDACSAPMVMIRRGRWKFIHTPSDPDQLFDVEADPLELVNLAESAENRLVLQAARAEVAGRWDLDAVDRDVRASQQARLTVFEALQTGQAVPWDFQPSRTAAKQYTRNTMDVAERDQQSRFPPIA